MNEHRRAGAPRLIDWTGERCVPWAPDIQVVYEHLHRYAWAAELVAGRRVLDLASGEGFGSAILAEQATSVVGVDLDPQTVEHAQLNYAGARIEFRVADALQLGVFPDDSFGAVVAFEMIEHVADHATLLEEISRVLEPGGLLVISTPDRRAYSGPHTQANPFHVHELDADEFRQTLGARFANVALWGQRTQTGSALSALDESSGGPPAQTRFIERAGEGWRAAGAMSPLYLIGIASNVDLPTPPSDAVMADLGLTLLRAVERQAAVDLQRAAEAARQRVEAADQATDQARRDTAGAVASAEASGAALADRIIDLDTLRRQVERLRAGAQDDRDTIVALSEQAAASAALVSRIEASISWRLFRRARGRVFAAVGGERSRPVRTLQWSLRTVARGAAGLPRRPSAMTDAGRVITGGERIDLPSFAQPDVSIVIPVHSRADLTRRCLESIRDNTSGVSYEVIVVDDSEEPETKALLSVVDGARVLVNQTNLGYLRSVNAGAALARGRWLVLANNDIEVYPEWLEALVACGESAPDIGVVTPKYLYPDGHLSEAGGVVWSDGSAANYGRGKLSDGWRYEYRRDVDYGSAAALLVRHDFWRERGGYDERFTPMYYEDVDLCMDARERGLRVVYQPEANVIHHEGATAGTDIKVGHKRHQEENRLTFVAKWAARLKDDHLTTRAVATTTAVQRITGPHVLIIDHRVPMPDRDAGSVRMLSMTQALRTMGCRVSFLPDNLAAFQPYTRELQRMGVEVLYPPIHLERELRALGPDIDLAILSRPHVTSRWLDLVREVAPRARVAYDTVDLHWLREARRYALNGRDSGAIGPKAAALREIELALIRATDTTLVVTEDERRQVEADVPGADVRVIPIVHRLRALVPPPEDRSGVIFIGGFEHTPNIDAVLMLVRDVMPLVWQTGAEVPVTVIGADAPPEVQALASSRVKIAGWIPDLEQLLGSAVALVAPLTYGAGLKGKVTQALADGLPVITTPIGAEGLDATDGDQLLIGTNAAELAERVIRVAVDHDLWRSLSSAGQALITEHFSPAVMNSELARLLADPVRGDLVAAVRAWPGSVGS